MKMSDSNCTNSSYPHQPHPSDPILDQMERQSQSETVLIEQQSARSSGHASHPAANLEQGSVDTGKTNSVAHSDDRDAKGLRRIIKNFTPSWFIVTMSTGILSIVLHQLPYNGRWLHIISTIYFVLNLTIFLIFTFVSCLRYILYPDIFPAVLRHPHQSLFLATFPASLATVINMTVLVCAPAWGHGMAIFAWVLWWIDAVLAVTACSHLTFVILSNRRSELAEMTALYLIPIVAVVLAATTGAIVASAIPNIQLQLWTLIISYIFWGIGSPLSWIILTLYFLRLTVHKPLEREVIVSLLLPIGPLSLSGFSLITLGKLAKHVFTATRALPHVAHAGDVFYIVGVLIGLVLWGFAVIWFVVAVIMIVVSGGFPFNMGWWGFVFPVCVFTLLTISIGEELESRFFKVTSCVLAGICIIMWFVVAVGTMQRSVTAKKFFAPCLGTDLFHRRAKEEQVASEDTQKTV